MTAQVIDMTMDDGTAEAYLARPDSNEELPGVLFFMDALGLRPRIQEMIERIASWGFVVLAPNVFYRLGSAESLRPTIDLRIPENRVAFGSVAVPRVKTLTPELFRGDAARYVKALRAQPNVSTGPIGTTGYCMGGALAMRVAAQFPDQVAATGSFHGGNLVIDSPESPHLLLSQIKAELYFGHADHDPSMPSEAIARLEAGLAAGGHRFTSELYPDAPHGYTMADTASYQEAGAERHFAVLADLFSRNLHG